MTYIHRTKAYKVILSTGEPVQIEQEEVQKLIDNAHVRGLIAFKRGLINPAFVVSVVDDKDRIKQFMAECAYNTREPDGRTQGEHNKERGMSPLKTIFEGDLAQKLKEGSIETAKKLGIAKTVLSS